MYPSSAVPGRAVLRIVGCLGHGELKPKLAVQALLLRWLIMVYAILDDQAVLSRAYPVLFNLLDTAAIRYGPCVAMVVHILSLHICAAPLTDQPVRNCAIFWP